MVLYKSSYEREDIMKNYLEKGKTISDLLAEGKTVDVKNIDDVLKHLSTDELLQLFNHAMNQKR